MYWYSWMFWCSKASQRWICFEISSYMWNGFECKPKSRLCDLQYLCYIQVICLESLKLCLWGKMRDGKILLGTTTKYRQKQWKSQTSQQGQSAELKEPQGVLTKCEIKPGRGSGELVSCQWEQQVYFKHNTCQAPEWRQQCLSRRLIGLIVVDRTSVPTHFTTALWHLHLKVKDEDGRICASEQQTIWRKLKTTEENADRIMTSPQGLNPLLQICIVLQFFRNLTCSEEILLSVSSLWEASYNRMNVWLEPNSCRLAAAAPPDKPQNSIFGRISAELQESSLTWESQVQPAITWSPEVSTVDVLVRLTIYWEHF